MWKSEREVIIVAAEINPILYLLFQILIFGEIGGIFLFLKRRRWPGANVGIMSISGESCFGLS
jgi:hypothetical protein